MNRARQLFAELSAATVGERWQPKNDAVLLIRVKKDEQLFSKLEEAVIISKKTKSFRNR